MEQKIKSITEAFSMQPVQINIDNAKTVSSGFEHNYIKEIKLERLQVSPFSNDEEDYYVGYDYNGNKSFQYLAKSVNVHYYYE